MKLPLAYYGASVLRQKTQSVEKITEEIKELVANMIETMRENDGIGLAAPQIHRSLSIFVIEVPVEIPENPEETHWAEGVVRVFINPKILSHSEEVWNRSEGCLSIPGVYGDVIRPCSIVVRAMDLNGEIFEKEFSDLEARAIMHENDHINGVLYIDRMHPKERKKIENQLQIIKKKYKQFNQ